MAMFTCCRAGNRQIVRLQSEVDQLGVLGVVIVGFGLRRADRAVIDFRAVLVFSPPLPRALPGRARILFGELVVNTALTRPGRILAGARYSGRYREYRESSSLTALSIHGERLAMLLARRNGWSTVPRRRRSRSGDERLSLRDFVGRCRRHALVEIGGANAPDLQANIMLWYRELWRGDRTSRAAWGKGGRLWAVVLDFDVAFFDVDIGRAVFAMVPSFTR